MRSATRLTSAVFQLTPTRTRFELFIIDNDKKEKIASGLINPFLAHLKIAQDEIGKGGYSILLKPETGSDTAWFTKATMERFIRFVSTPEILERVYTVESEILQIEEAISMQNSDDLGTNTDDFCHNSVENLHKIPGGSNTGAKSIPDADEKAIILYKPVAPLIEANGAYQCEQNSKLQLLKVLENRKTVLQKEQGMAFARAVAAGFDIDHMEPLIAFAECFGAQRLNDACSRFQNLWKHKHETGQWLDIPPSEALDTESEFSMLNTSGIVLSDSLSKHDEPSPVPSSQTNGRLDPRDEAGDGRSSTGPQDCYQAHFPQLMYPPWPVHSMPGGQQVYQAYPVQGLPYYQPYAANHFFQPHHRNMEHYPSNSGPYLGLNGRPHDTRDHSAGLDTLHNNGTASPDVMAPDAQVHQSSMPQSEVVGGSKKKRSGRVVIRNINYISSERKCSASEADSDSLSDSDGENENFDAALTNRRSSRGRGSQKSVEKLSLHNDEFCIARKDTDGGDWQAFQECLLRKSDENHNEEEDGIFAVEKDVARAQKKTNSASDDSLLLFTRKSGGIRDGRTVDMNQCSETAFLKPVGSGDELLTNTLGNDLAERNNHETDFQFSEANGRNFLNRIENEEFFISRRATNNFQSSSDPRDMNGFYGGVGENDRDYSNGMSDESLSIPFRSMSLDQIKEADRADIHIYSEIPFENQKLEEAERRDNAVSYEPDDLSWFPERGGIDKRSIEYNPAMDYEMQVCAEESSKEKSNNNVTNDLGASKKPDKVSRKSNAVSSGGSIRKSSTTLKVSPRDDARARAERIRSFKADMQRVKKEKEETEMKRLKCLKIERQKRIAARGGSKLSGSSSSSPLRRSKTSVVSSSPLSQMRRLSEPNSGH